MIRCPRRTPPDRVVNRGWSRRGWLLAGGVALLLAGLPLPRAGAATPAEVDAAITKAKDFLRKQQKGDGSWEPTQGGHDPIGGNTALATYALLAGGDSPQDEHIKKAVRFLGNVNTKNIYVIGVRAQVWPYLEMNKEVRAAVWRDAELLLKSAQQNTGRFSYTTPAGGSVFYHNSTSQYGVLGLWAAARAGYEVPGKFWQAAENGWRACQDPKTGGWAYHSVVPHASGDPNDQVRASMTTAGLASLFVAQDYLRAGEGVKCNGNVTNVHIEAGLKWMSDNYPAGSDNGYLLYGIERVGVASGYKYFGKHDWYATGSDVLVKKQAPNGSWGTHGPIPGTSFGIFFLTRGRAPVVLNKLEYAFDEPAGSDAKAKKRKGKDAIANWNQRPRDAANAVRWIGENIERDLNWQIVNLRVGADDLLDAPILYIAGDQQLRFSDEDKQKLKRYVEAGGIILAQADCGKAEFAKSFRALGAELFPYEFRQLPPAHPVFNELFNADKWKNKIEVEGMSNGVRELMLLVPREDVSRSWQTVASANKEHHFALLANVFMYAVDKSNLRFKGETYALTPKAGVKPRRTIKVARVRYAGNWDPEPGGWRRLGVHLLNEHKLALAVDTVKLGGGGAEAATEAEQPGDKRSGAAKQKDAGGKSRGTADGGGGGKSRPENAGKADGGAGDGAVAGGPAEAAGPVGTSLKGYDVAHLTGTTGLRLDDAAREEVRRFVEAGGTLVVDAAGGSTQFADAVQRELSEIFKESAGQLDDTLKPDHAVYTLPLSKVTEVGYRTFAKDKLGKGLKNPRVRAIAVKGRPAVFFSREDLSTGLVGQPVDGVFGYDPRSATQLMTNVILFATGEGKPPSPQPAGKVAGGDAGGEKKAAKKG